MPHASLRLNLDESGSVPDGVLATCLSTVRLWSHFWTSSSGQECADHDQSQELGPEHYQDQEIVAMILETKLSALPVLSGGQTQLLALARALVKKWLLASSTGSGTDGVDPAFGANPTKPPLLLDEATASLDPVTEGIVYDVIDREFSEQGHTVIMVTHRPSVLAGRMRHGKGDMVVFLADGRVESVQTGSEAVELERMLEES